MTLSEPENPPTGPRRALDIHTTVASPARVWNYWVGGKDNFAADREAGERVIAAVPFMPLMARYSRRFLINAVHRLATDHGIRQFLDIGTGLPTADNTHEVAQRAAPEARIVYVDNDRCKSGCAHACQAGWSERGSAPACVRRRPCGQP